MFEHCLPSFLSFIEKMEILTENQAFALCAKTKIFGIYCNCTVSHINPPVSLSPGNQRYIRSCMKMHSWRRSSSMEELKICIV